MHCSPESCDFLSQSKIQSLANTRTPSAYVQYSHQQKTTGKSTIQRFWYEREQTSRKFDFLLIFSCVQFCLDTVLPKYMHFVTISKDLLAIFTLRFCPECCSGDMNIHIFFSYFTFRPTCLLENNNACVFIYSTLCFLPLN
jgi:hypothetical protein